MLQRSPSYPASPVPRAPAPGLAPASFTAPPAAPAAERAGRPTPAAILESALARLEEIVDQETAALRGYVAVNLKEFNDRKNHALLELTRALRQLPAGKEGEALGGRVDRLRTKLELNRIVLRMHLDAVREVSMTISDAIRDAESDGTYSQTVRHATKAQ